MNEKDKIISAIRILAGDTRLYLRERIEALAEIQAEAARQFEWAKAERPAEGRSE